MTQSPRPGAAPRPWPRIAGRQLAIFVNGLAGSGPAGMPGPAVTREEVETAFAFRASPRSPAGASPAPVTDNP